MPIVRSLNKLCLHFLIAGVGLVGLTSVAGFFGQINMFVEALANFRALYVIFFLLSAALLAALKLFKGSCLAAAFLILNASTFAPFFIKPADKTADSESKIRINQLLEIGNLHDSEQGFGFQPTWCAWVNRSFPSITACSRSNSKSSRERRCKA